MQQSPGESRVLGGGRVSCIMHDGCYFHHTVLSGVIVHPAPSAQIALCTDCYLSIKTPFYYLLLSPFPSLFTILLNITIYHCFMETALEVQVGFINQCCLMSSVDPSLVE